MRGGVIDHCISKPHNGVQNEFIVSKWTGCKKVVFVDHKPYFCSFAHGNVKVVALHCSGGYKIYMRLFSKQRVNVILLLFVYRIFMKIKK